MILNKRKPLLTQKERHFRIKIQTSFDKTTLLLKRYCQTLN